MIKDLLLRVVEMTGKRSLEEFFINEGARW